MIIPNRRSTNAILDMAFPFYILTQLLNISFLLLIIQCTDRINRKTEKSLLILTLIVPQIC